MNNINKIKPLGWRRNIDYTKINFYILYKRMLEYKVNIWSSFFSELFFLLTFYIFAFSLVTSLDFLPWTFEYFALYLILFTIIDVFTGLFVWKYHWVFHLIKYGLLNNYLTKPLNTLFYHTFYLLSANSLVMLILDIIVFIFIILYYQIVLQNILISTIYFLLISLFIISMWYFFDSLHFIKLGLGYVIMNPMNNCYDMFQSYPSIFFKNIKYRIGLFIIPSFFIGTLLFPSLRGYEIKNLQLQLTLLISFIILFSFLTWYNWKNGLRKYEAFG